ncbi:MAG TPA: hypothetical protein DHV62_02675 [Elusimicrobia bacterium]|jgi:metal-responsive CopG/Arc/MetJ family transcriptional regulator|nr:hypothetical protein [Elusimicrobiota bacterium]
MRECVHISATINKNLLEKVNNFCRREERSKSWLISKAVERLLKDLEPESVFSADEWEKIEKLANQKGKIYMSKRQAKQHLAKL